MNALGKTAAFITAAVMMITGVPALARAAHSFTSEAGAVSPFDVQNIIIEAKSGAALFSDTFEDQKKAASDELRDALKRNESFVTITLEHIDDSVDVDYLCDSEEMQHFIEKVWDEVLSMAFAHTGAPDEGDYMSWRINHIKSGSNGTRFDFDHIRGYYVQLDYIIGTYYTTVEQETAVEKRVAEVLESLDLEGDSDYMKIKKIYEWICENVTYDYKNLDDESYTLKYTAYAALFLGTSVCQGYASLFYRMLLNCGIDCRQISGTGYNVGGSGPHAWNIVKLGDKYYNLDTTWDAGNAKFKYFLLSNKSFSGHVRDDKYMTGEFDAAYPMAGKNYVPTEMELLKKLTVAPDYIGKIEAGMTNDDAAAIIINILDKNIKTRDIICYYAENDTVRRVTAKVKGSTLTFNINAKEKGKIFIWDKDLRPVINAIK